jgi:hypothetical protein
MTDLERMEEMLSNAGYDKVDAEYIDGDANRLGHKEYFVVSLPKFQILALGPGRTGEEGCFANLNFTHEGKFAEHGSMQE